MHTSFAKCVYIAWKRPFEVERFQMKFVHLKIAHIIRSQISMYNIQNLSLNVQDMWS